MFNQTDFDQFNKVFNNLNKDLRSLSFYSPIGASIDDTNEFNTFRRRIECRKALLFDIGFGHDENEVWCYLTFLVDKKKYQNSLRTSERLAVQLENYKLDDEMKDHYRIAASEKLENWTSGDDIDDKKITDWFRERIQEIKDKSRIQRIINNAN
jgi:hypothetical protein